MDDLKQLGLDAFAVGNFQVAVDRFSDALQQQQQQQQHDNKDAFVKLLLNRSAAYLKLGHWKQALDDAQMAKGLESEIVCKDLVAKAWFREGEAWLGGGKFELAEGSFEQSLVLAPGNAQAQKAILLVKSAQQVTKKEMDKVYVRCKFGKKDHELFLDPRNGALFLEEACKLLHINKTKCLFVSKGQKLNAENIPRIIERGSVMQAFGEVMEDDSRCDERDIAVLMGQLSMTRNDAVKALNHCHQDLISTISQYG